MTTENYSSLKCVHKIYRANFGKRFNLHKLAHLGRLYTHKPQMLRVTGEKSTLLLFATGKAILHGSLSLPEKFKQVVYFDEIPEINIVTMTFVYNFNRILNLSKIKELYPRTCLYEPELFCALVISTDYKHVKANLFHTGKLIIMGCTSHDQAKSVVCGVTEMLLFEKNNNKQIN